MPKFVSHTPGPWFRDTITDDEGMTENDMRSVTDADANEVALVAPGDNRDANADLIASAPDLLEALWAIATALDVGRNRFGKLESSLSAGEPLRQLAIRYQVGGAEDAAHQAVLVARAAIVKANGLSPTKESES